jgi:hypothetical protein
MAAALSIAAVPAADAAAAQSGRGRSSESRPGKKGDERTNAAPSKVPQVDVRSLGQKGRPYGEPAFAAGYEDGHSRGLSDGTDGQRYDPVRHAAYRDAERGYRESYGSREAYRTNYRAGFRQGYEEGYRLGTRNRQ